MSLVSTLPPPSASRPPDRTAPFRRGSSVVVRLRSSTLAICPALLETAERKVQIGRTHPKDGRCSVHSVRYGHSTPGSASAGEGPARNCCLVFFGDTKGRTTLPCLPTRCRRCICHRRTSR